MPTKRIRIIAGPNGSGKTTLIERIKNHVHLGVFINADEIENIIKKTKKLSFSAYKVTATNKDFLDFTKQNGFSSLATVKSKSMLVVNNELHLKSIDSYIASDVAAFIRYKLLKAGESFSFETVMSHESKIEFIQEAKKQGYRVYLYFVSTEHPSININRVKIRVSANGHHVSPDKIVTRYYRTMGLLHNAIKISDRAYLFDNTNLPGVLFAEIEGGNLATLLCAPSNVPNWFLEYK